MLNRRSFIQHSTALTLGGLLLRNDAFANHLSAVSMPEAGLQLFTLFGLIEKDVPGSVQKIAALGYKHIESAFSDKGRFYGYTGKEFNTMLKDHGLSWKSHHVMGAPFKMPPGAKLPVGADGKPITIPPMKNLRDNMQELIDMGAEAGVHYLVCASTPYSTTEELKASINTLNKSNEAARKAGLILVYHNHDGEFKAVEGKIPYDALLNDTELKMELDICWTTKAGIDAVELFKKHQGRFPLWHVKDIDKEMKGPQPVGTGIIDWKKIFDNASLSGMKHYFIEHDMPADAFGSIQTSFENLRKILG